MEKINNKKLLLTGKAFLAINKSDLRAAGYSLSDLRAAGYLLSDLIAAGYSLSDLIAAGYLLSDFRAAGYSLYDLRAAGYSVSDLRAAGYSLYDLRAARYLLSDLIAAGYSLSDLRAAGYSLSDLREIERIIKDIPKLEKPYSKLWKDIQTKNRIHKQSTWGPEKCPKVNLCGTPMCTAGHLVNLCGDAGYKLKDATSWEIAAEIIHNKAHPDIPHQDFGNIPQDVALAYIEQMAAIEEEETSQEK